MWRHPPFWQFAQQVAAVEHVSEVLVINNDPAHQPMLGPSHHKTRLAGLNTNLFVNPSWNWGMSQTKSPLVCLMNDDIIFDVSVFAQVALWFRPYHGVLGLGNGDSQACTTVMFDKYQPYQSVFGFGQLMFFNRHHWCNIDAELLVFGGDNWIFDHMQALTNNNHVITGLRYHTPYATTSRHHRHKYQWEMQRYEQLAAKKSLVMFHD